LVLRANENSILPPSIEISLMPFSLLVGWTFLTPIYPFAAFNELFSFASFSSQIECRVTRVRITEWFKVKVWKTRNSECLKGGINVNWTWKWKPICFNHSCNNIWTPLSTKLQAGPQFSNTSIKAQHIFWKRVDF
jgi:hypothetical protein